MSAPPIDKCKTADLGDKTKCVQCDHGYLVQESDDVGGSDSCVRAYYCNNGSTSLDEHKTATTKVDSTYKRIEKCLNDSCNSNYKMDNHVCVPKAGTAEKRGANIQKDFIVTAEQQRHDIILYVSLFFVMLLIGFFIMKKMGVTSKKTGIFSWIGSDIKVNDLPVAFWVFAWTFIASLPIWWFGVDHCIQWGEDGKKILNYRSENDMEPEICNRMRRAGVPIPNSFFGGKESIPNEACERPDGQCWNFHWRHFISFALTIIVCYIIFTALIVGAMPAGKFPDGIPLVLIISIFAFSVETGWKRATWREKHNTSTQKMNSKTLWKPQLTTDYQKPMVAQWQPIMLMGIIGFIIFGLFVFGGIGNKSLNDIDTEEKVMFGIVAVGWFIHWGYDVSQTYDIPFSSKV